MCLTAFATDGMAQSMDWSVYEEKLRAPLITRTDDQFLAKNLEFVWGVDGLDLIELNDLFEKVAQPSYSCVTL